MRILHFFRNVGFVRAVKGVLIILPVLLFFWLLQQNLLLGNATTVRYSPGSRTSVVSPTLKSLAGTLSERGPLRWRLADDSLSFGVRFPRGLDSVRIRLTLNNIDQYALSFGALKKDGEMQNELLYYAFLNQLPWKTVTDGTFTLWQQPSYSQKVNDTKTQKEVTRTVPIREYSSIADFEQNLPDISSIAVLGVDKYRFFRIPSYVPATEQLVIPHAFRGSHTLLAYADYEDISLSFNKIDLNRSKGRDDLAITVSYAGRRLSRQVVKDDGKTTGNGQRGPLQSFSLTVPNVGAGLYTIELETTDDVLTTEYRSAQRYVQFVDHVFLADGPAYGFKEPFQPVVIETNGKSLSFETTHEQGLQRFKVGKGSYAIDTFKKPLNITRTNSAPVIVTVPKGDVYISSDTALSLAPAQFFELQITKALPVEPSPDISGIHYIFSTYKIVSGTESSVIDRTFDVSRLSQTNHRLRFELDAPGLYEYRRTLYLNQIRVTMKAKPITWSTIWQKISSLVHKGGV